MPSKATHTPAIGEPYTFLGSKRTVAPANGSFREAEVGDLLAKTFGLDHLGFRITKITPGLAVHLPWAYETVCVGDFREYVRNLPAPASDPTPPPMLPPEEFEP